MNKELIAKIDEMTNGEFSRRFVISSTQPALEDSLQKSSLLSSMDSPNARKPIDESANPLLSELLLIWAEAANDAESVALLELVQKRLVEMRESRQAAIRLLYEKDQPNNVVITAPSGVHVEFTKPDLSMMGERKPGWFRKQPVRVNGEAEGGGIQGCGLVPLRTIEPILNWLEPPKSTPTGRTFLSPPNMDFDGDVLDELFMEQMLREKAKLLRGLLRSKTKRGPKRRYAYK